MDSKPHHPHLERLLNSVEALPPLKTAVVPPVCQTALSGVVETARHELIEPIHIGPKQRIETAAHSANLDISDFLLDETEYSHTSAKFAVEMAKDGRVLAIMKGNIHTDKLMGR